MYGARHRSVHARVVDCGRFPRSVDAKFNPAAGFRPGRSQTLTSHDPPVRALTRVQRRAHRARHRDDRRQRGRHRGGVRVSPFIREQKRPPSSAAVFANRA